MSPAPLEVTSRDRLLSVAIDLFTRRGYAATSVREIVEAAGLTKPALYYHFGSKEGLYLAILQEVERLVSAGIAAHADSPGSARQRLERLLLGLFGLFEANQAAVRFLNSVFWGPAQGAPAFDIESFHSRLTTAVAAIVADGVNRGELRGGDPATVANALIGVLSFSMDLTLAHPQLGPGRDGLSRTLELLFNGIAAPAAPHSETSS